MAPSAQRTVNSPAPLSLDRAKLEMAYAVHQVIYPPGVDWPQRLEEVGFLPGERVIVIARGKPGNDPLAVRVGHSTFALRRAEAACVQVRPWPVSPDAQ
jgi:ferrous iron transport protein A